MIPQICFCLSQEFYSRVAESGPKFLNTFLIEWFYQEMCQVSGMSEMNEISVTESCLTELWCQGFKWVRKKCETIKKGLVSGSIF